MIDVEDLLQRLSLESQPELKENDGLIKCFQQFSAEVKGLQVPVVIFLNKIDLIKQPEQFSTI